MSFLDIRVGLAKSVESNDSDEILGSLLSLVNLKSLVDSDESGASGASGGYILER